MDPEYAVVSWHLSLLPLDSFVEVADCYSAAVVATLNLVSIKVLPHSANRLSAFVALDGSSAPVAEVADYATMAVVYLIAVLVEPVNYQARDSPLL
jgi:hypothetical protein